MFAGGYSDSVDTVDNPLNSDYYNQFKRLEEFRQADVMTDVTFLVGDVRHRAHRLILSLHSPVFEAMFKSGMQESRSGVIVVDDVESDVFSSFLKFIYTGELKWRMSLSQATSLLVCADKYQTTSLLTEIDKKLTRIATPYNAAEVLLIADTFNRTELRNQIRTLMWIKFGKTSTSESWENVIRDNSALKNDMLDYFHRGAMLKYDDFVVPRTRRHNSGRYRRSCLLTNWTRPVGVRLTYDAYPIDFAVMLSQIGEFWVMSVRPMEKMPKGVVVYFKAEVSTAAGPVESELKIAWDGKDAHPTLGQRRVTTLKWRSDGTTSVDFEMELYGDDRTNCTIVKTWIIETNPPQEHRQPDDHVIVNVDGSSERFYADKESFERLTSTDAPVNINVSDVTTASTIVRYVNTSRFPHRDAVNSELLAAAYNLHLWELILYVEQILIWELDCSNVLALGAQALQLRLGWLTAATAQFLRFYLDRVKLVDDNWKTLSFDYFQVVMTEMNSDFYPRLLPQFLYAKRVRNRNLN